MEKMEDTYEQTFDTYSTGIDYTEEEYIDYIDNIMAKFYLNLERPPRDFVKEKAK